MSFHTVYGFKILKWFANPFSSRPSFPEPPIISNLFLGVSALAMTDSFIELHKADPHVTILVVFWPLGAMGFVVLGSSVRSLMDEV